MTREEVERHVAAEGAGHYMAMARGAPAGQEPGPEEWFCEECGYGWDDLTDMARYTARQLVGPLNPLWSRRSNGPERR